MEYLVLVIGFILLIKGADLFVDGSISVAKKLHIPSIIIGLTIVAMGTSAPEAAVSISASLKGSNAIAIGNIIGSNIFNLLVVVGACALIKPVKVKKSILTFDYPIAIFASVVILILCFGELTIGKTNLTNYVDALSRSNGVFLLVLMAVFIVYTIIKAKKERITEEEEYQALSGIKTVLFIIIGITGVIVGGQVVVDSAKTIAASFGLSDSLIGLTVVAIGTSLPELVTSIVAAKKGESDLALGNVIGSNIFNTFFILGMTSVVGAIPVMGFTVVDIILAIAAAVIVYIFAVTKQKINRIEGGIMIVLYIVFTIYLILRQMAFGI